MREPGVFYPPYIDDGKEALRLSQFAAQRESTTTTTIVISNRHFIKCLLWAKHCLKCFTGVNFGISQRGATIMLILQMRPERLRNLPKGTQLVGGRSRSKPGKFGFSALMAAGLWLKSEVWMLTFSSVFFLITMSVEVAICLHCFSHSDQLSGLHITFPLFESAKSRRDKKNWKSSFCNLTLLFQMLSSVIILILSLFILIIAFHGNLGLLQLAA